MDTQEVCVGEQTGSFRKHQGPVGWERCRLGRRCTDTILCGATRQLRKLPVAAHGPVWPSRTHTHGPVWPSGAHTHIALFGPRTPTHTPPCLALARTHTHSSFCHDTAPAICTHIHAHHTPTNTCVNSCMHTHTHTALNLGFAQGQASDRVEFKVHQMKGEKQQKAMMPKQALHLMII